MMLSMFQDFHFIRPYWLLGILAAAVILLLCWRRQLLTMGWQQVIAPELLSFISDAELQQRQRWPLIAMAIAWLLTCIALAGPTWQKIPQPVLQKNNALVIVLDLSLSMYAEDIQPSRIVRARHKIKDLLRTRKEGLTGLIVYAGDAHGVAPLSDDTDTISNLLPALTPEIMPEPGSNPVNAIKQAIQLFENAGIPDGRILLISDGIEPQDINKIAKLINNNQLNLAIMGVATPAGAPIPAPNGNYVKDSTGEIIVPKLNRERFEQLAERTQGKYMDISLNDSDIAFLSQRGVDSKDIKQFHDKKFDQWQDLGTHLVILLIPIAMLAFRRGWIICLPFFFVAYSENSYAFGWRDLWQNDKQQAINALNNGEYEIAKNYLNDPQWQGYVEYQTENFQQALDYFQQSQDADGFYNQGNALAKLNQFEKAIERYNKAIAIDPKHEDAIFNKRVLEKLLEMTNDQSEKENQQNNANDDRNRDQASPQSGNQDQQNKNDAGENTGQQNAQNNRSNDDSSQNEGEPKNSDNNTREQGRENNKQSKPMDKSSDEQNQESLQQRAHQNAQQNSQKQLDPNKPNQFSQAKAGKFAEEPQPRESSQPPLTPEAMRQQDITEQWLRQIPDDPAGLLRRKFYYENQLRKAKENNSKEFFQ